MISHHEGYEIDDSRERIDFAAVHAWLSTSYWSPGIERDKIERGARSSALVLGAYRDGEQVGFARVVSDTTRFAYLCDVWVAAEHRGRGLARAMVQHAIAHPELATVTGWCLKTEDAHGVYAALGFTPLPAPDRWMEFRRPAAPPEHPQPARPPAKGVPVSKPPPGEKRGGE